MGHDAPPELIRAIDEFNNWEWFECHETLEELWTGEHGELRYLYQGVLQVAVALHHWRNGNYNGALSLLERGAAYLDRVRPDCLGLDVAGAASAALRFRGVLLSLGESRMWQVERALVPQLRMVHPT